MRHLTKLTVAVFLVVVVAAGCSGREGSEPVVIAPTTTISVPETTTTIVLEVSTTTALEAPTTEETAPETPLCFLGNKERTQSFAPVIRVNYAEWLVERGNDVAIVQWEAQCADDAQAMWSTAETEWEPMEENCSNISRWTCHKVNSEPGGPTEVRLSAVNDNAHTVVTVTLFD